MNKAEDITRITNVKDFKRWLITAQTSIQEYLRIKRKLCESNKALKWNVPYIKPLSS